MSNHEHHHAPCVEQGSGSAMLHLVKQKGLIEQRDYDVLHSAQGCGSCPQAAKLGTCVVLNAIGPNLQPSQRREIVRNITKSS